MQDDGIALEIIFLNFSKIACMETCQVIEEMIGLVHKSNIFQNVIDVTLKVLLS